MGVVTMVACVLCVCSHAFAGKTMISVYEHSLDKDAF
jgi:hypothetical protein